MLVVCIRMLVVCMRMYSYVPYVTHMSLVCYPYVTRMYSCGVLVMINGKRMTKKLICCLSWPGREDLSADLLPEILKLDNPSRLLKKIR